MVQSPNGEMVDTRDLKSLDHYGRAGSIPVSGTRVDLYTDNYLQTLSALRFRWNSNQSKRRIENKALWS